MSLTQLKLDPKSTALVLIDLQNGIVSMQVEPQPGSEVVERSRRLAQAFRAAGAPVVLVTVGNAADGRDALAPTLDSATPPMNRPADWSEVVAALEAQPSDLRIMKRQWGAFYGTELDLQLRRRGIRTIVLAGIATHVGVESTARDAFERAYDQVFVTDAMASPSAEAHANTLKYVFPRIGRMRTTQEVIAALG